MFWEWLARSGERAPATRTRGAAANHDEINLATGRKKSDPDHHIVVRARCVVPRDRNRAPVSTDVPVRAGEGSGCTAQTIAAPPAHPRCGLNCRDLFARQARSGLHANAVVAMNRGGLLKMNGNGDRRANGDTKNCASPFVSGLRVGA